jgi:hypothetical protein
MSASPWKSLKPASGTCLCGNIANARKGNDWVCDRCRHLEAKQYHKSKAHTAGMKQRRVCDAINAEVPV